MNIDFSLYLSTTDNLTYKIMNTCYQKVKWDKWGIYIKNKIIHIYI